MSSALLIIADDHPLFRAALLAAVEKMFEGAQIVECDSFGSLQGCMQRHPEADLVLLDLNMPGAQGFSSLIHLRAEYPSVPVAVISAQEEPAVIRRAQEFGAAGFIPKSSNMDAIGNAIHTVLEGGEWWPSQIGEVRPDERQLAAGIASLTPQQLRILMMIADGMANKVIGADLNITEGTVKSHVTAVLRKLNLYRRTQLIIVAQKLLTVRGEPFNVGFQRSSEVDEEN